MSDLHTENAERKSEREKGPLAFVIWKGTVGHVSKVGLSVFGKVVLQQACIKYIR